MLLQQKKYSTKYENLLRVDSFANVPRIACLGEGFFQQALVDYQRFNDEINSKLHEIQATSGAFLRENFEEIQQILAEIVFHPNWSDILTKHLQNVFTREELRHNRFSIRSAAKCEDLTTRSFAGLYESKLNVQGFIHIGEAVLQVWRSYFSFQALLERLSAGLVESDERMNVIVQFMVEPIYAGVAFTIEPVTREPGCFIEFVEGLGEQLMSGEREPQLYSQRNGSIKKKPVFYDEINAVIEKAKALFEHEIDMEWAWDGKILWVLQIRPISTAVDNQQMESLSTESLLDYIPLYFAKNEEFERFHPVAEFVNFFRHKRAPLYLFVRQFSALSGQAILLRCNREGLEDDDKLLKLIQEFIFSQVVVDMNDRVRQQVVLRTDLVDYLRLICRVPGKIYKIVIRDFIKGELGVITTVDEKNRVVLELTKEGLLALNRGTADSNLFIIGESTESKMPLSVEALSILQKITLASQQSLGKIQIEWVIHQGTPFAVDYSFLDEGNKINLTGFYPDLKILSQGRVNAPVYRLKETELLVKYSEGPKISLSNCIPDTDNLDIYFKEIIQSFESSLKKQIVVVSRPYAALAALIPYVAGFVFEAGSILCHLAILLREHSIPAIASKSLFASIDNQTYFSIDTYQGVYNHLNYHNSNQIEMKDGCIDETSNFDKIIFGGS